MFCLVFLSSLYFPGSGLFRVLKDPEVQGNCSKGMEMITVNSFPVHTFHLKAQLVPFNVILLLMRTSVCPAFWDQYFFCFVLKQFVFSSATGLMFSTIWITIPPCWGWNKGDVHFSFSLSVNRLFVGNNGCQYAPHANVWEKRYGNGTFYCRYALYADFMKLVN